MTATREMYINLVGMTAKKTRDQCHSTNMASTIFLIIASVATAFMLSLDLTVVFTMALLAVALAAPLAAVSVCLCRRS